MTQDIRRQLNRAGGPDNNFGALLALSLVPMTNTMFTNTIGTVTVPASFSAVGTQNLAAANCLVYSSSDSNVVEITSDGIIRERLASATV